MLEIVGNTRTHGLLCFYVSSNIVIDVVVALTEKESFLVCLGMEARTHAPCTGDRT